MKSVERKKRNSTSAQKAKAKESTFKCLKTMISRGEFSTYYTALCIVITPFLIWALPINPFVTIITMAVVALFTYVVLDILEAAEWFKDRVDEFKELRGQKDL